jgi:mono/diheme cytochrome c family protein
MFRLILGFFLTLAAGLLLLAFAGPAAAQCSIHAPGYATQSYTPSYQTHVTHDVTFTRVLAVIPLLDLPSYSASYVPAATPPAPAAAAQTAGPSAEMKEVVSILKGFDARLKRLEAVRAAPAATPARTPAPVMPPAVDAPASATGAGKLTLADVNKASCAACHQKGNESAGGDFVISDSAGVVRHFSDRELVSLTKHISRGTMPKQNARAKERGVLPLDDAAVEVWMEEINKQGETNKQAQ